jgi:hypothetical protein
MTPQPLTKNRLYANFSRNLFRFFLYKPGEYTCMNSRFPTKGSFSLYRNYWSMLVHMIDDEAVSCRSVLSRTYLRRSRAWVPSQAFACAGTRAALWTGRRQQPRNACRSRPAPPSPPQWYPSPAGAGGLDDTNSYPALGLEHGQTAVAAASFFIRVSRGRW